MKKKNLKLNFNKETVAKLNNNEMNNVKGGEPPRTYNCIPQTQVGISCMELSEANGTRCWTGTMACPIDNSVGCPIEIK